MMVTDRKTALEWLRSWAGKPRRGVLREVIRGLKMASSLSRGRDKAGLEEAIEVLAEVKP